MSQGVECYSCLPKTAWPPTLIIGLVRGYPWAVTGRLGALAATYVLEQVGTMNHHYTLPEFVARYRATFGDTPELADLLARTEKQDA